MPKSRNDPYKRKAAQALNHLAASILDLNDIYQAFEKQRDQQANLFLDTGEAVYKENADRYTAYTEDIKATMMQSAVIRQEVIQFIGKVWELDEESIRVYLG